MNYINHKSTTASVLQRQPDKANVKNTLASYTNVWVCANCGNRHPADDHQKEACPNCGRDQWTQAVE